ncbi:MAG TPA: phage integrase N-terminal SAM-like domain-containing protein [Herpetosiphonaceae bacterium]|nr:phage integrase N-terminal SAM-like domain-containing protein [Herpetosiphonaceae bacterium]
MQAVQSFAQHFGTSPDQLTEEHLRQYFLYLRNDKRVARSTSTIALCAIKFLFEHTLHRSWPVLDFIRPVPATGIIRALASRACRSPGSSVIVMQATEYWESNHRPALTRC